MKNTPKAAATLISLLASASPALAHLDPAEHGSFLAGLTHPLFGLDHVLAMLAVGLWASIQGGRLAWAVPAAFVGVMIAGFALALAGIYLPFVEPAILASVVAFGVLVALAVSMPAGVGVAVAGFFALFHGYAHGGEMGGAGAAGYVAGFVIATGLLHASGLAAGLSAARLRPGAGARALTGAAGAMTALGGVWLILAG